MREITISVTGEPVAKGRGRVGMVNGRPRVYTPARTRNWENDARQLARIEMGGDAPFEGPLEVDVLAVFPLPESMPKWQRSIVERGEMLAHTIAPDGDNILKASSDACNGIVWLDDKQICTVTVRKQYGARPRVDIAVRQLDVWHSRSKRGERA